MADNYYTLRQAPQATLDGTGLVAHDIEAYTSEGAPIPGRHQTVLIPEDDLQVVNEMLDGTSLERQDKVSAYKTLIATHLPVGWKDDDLQDIVDENADAQEQAELANTFIVDTLNQTYPVQFKITD